MLLLKIVEQYIFSQKKTYYAVQYVIIKIITKLSILIFFTVEKWKRKKLCLFHFTSAKP